MAERRSATIAARLTAFDVVGQRTGGRAVARQLAVALVALLALVALRSLLDAAARGVGPYAPVYPVVLFATLAGRLRAGLLTWLGSIGYVAFVNLPGSRMPVFAQPYGPSLTLINLVSTGIVMLMAEVARQHAGELVADREARIAERDMLLQEVDHRLKNNLALLSGLMGLQVRETANDEAREVLARAAARLQSLSQAYDNLRYEPGSVTVVDASVLLERLCESLRDALGLDGSVSLEAQTVPALIARDRASALALFVNEVVTNAAKHAFTDRGAGRIRLSLTRNGDAEALLEIADDGRGIDPASANGGRGRKLLDALAEMAGGELSVDSGAAGTLYRLRLRQLP